MFSDCVSHTQDFQDSSILATYIREFYSDCLSDDGRSIFLTLVFALLGVLLLKATYSLIDNKWPEAYTSVETHVNVHLRTNPIRTYLLFRGGPVFIIATFAAVSTERAQGMVWVGFWIMTIVYLGLTTGRAIREMLRPPRHPNWTMLSVFHVLSIFVVVSAGTLAVLLRSLFEQIIPEGQELSISIWAGLFATMMSGVARTLLSPKRFEGFEVVRAIKRDVGPKSWKYLMNSTPHQGNFLSLAMAFVLAESQQRPRWFRKLERLGGRFRGTGTYGVAQVAADGPLTDEESIDLMIERLDTAEVHRAVEDEHSSHEIYNLCLTWNDDGDHALRIMNFYIQVTELRKLTDELG